MTLLVGESGREDLLEPPDRRVNILRMIFMLFISVYRYDFNLVYNSSKTFKLTVGVFLLIIK